MPGEPGKVNSIVPPTVADRRIASLLAARIVQAGEGRVRRVVMVGSRALGTASPESDLDLVVLVEIPPNARPWATADCVRERRRIQGAVGTPPLDTDLWVRTTDQYEEARLVPGSIEFRVEVEGVTLFSAPFEREPRVRRTQAQVRRDYVLGWVEHAIAALEALAVLDVSTGAGGTRHPDAERAARAVVDRASTALLALHGVRAERDGGVAHLVSQLAVADHETAAEVERILAVGAASWQHLREVVRVALRRIARDPGAAARVKPLMRRTDRIHGSTPHR